MYVNLDMDLAARAQFLQGSQLLRLLNERATTAKGDERRPGAQGSAARVAGGRRSAPRERSDRGGAKRRPQCH